MAQAFFGGVHPHDMKAATNEKAIEQLAPPATVVIPIHALCDGAQSLRPEQFDALMGKLREIRKVVAV